MPAAIRPKLLWLMTARAVAVTLLLGSAILAQVRSPGSFPVDPFFFLIALTYGLTALYGMLLKRAEQHGWIVDIQLAGDALIVSALVQITGGIVSYFSPLYMLPIIAASTIRSWRGGLIIGVFSSAVYGVLVLAQYAGPVLAMTVTAGPPSAKVAWFTAGLNVFGFLAVAGLSGYLAESLRRADAQLLQASNQLADLQAFSQHVIDSLASGLATTDVHGRVITFNRAAEVITGIPADRTIGRSIADVLRWPAEVSGLFEAQDERPPLPRVEFELARADGRTIELGLSTAVLHTPSGETGFVFTFRDVTEARRKDREARTQQRLAAVGEMAAGIAHEIRNPLASMSGSIQILRDELPLTGEQAQLMDIVIRESERLNDTIRSFLAYAKPQRQAAACIDVRRTVSETATLLQNSPELQPAHVLSVDVPPAPVCCLADEAQIRQIVWNLASNALRAMPDGGALRLQVGAEAAEGGQGHLTIAVCDEGVGIEASEIDRILQPFRGGFARGTGLGLSIVHRIVSDYGGQLQVASAPGRGTTVTVRLPLCESNEASSFQRPASSLSASG